MSAAPFVIVEAIYPGMTQLDFTGPHTIFSRLVRLFCGIF
jgi:hypothetical protein